jgi:hypothetical protein
MRDFVIDLATKNGRKEVLNQNYLAKRVPPKSDLPSLKADAGCWL